MWQHAGHLKRKVLQGVSSCQQHCLKNIPTFEEYQEYLPSSLNLNE
jgi:hypothetical protein